MVGGVMTPPYTPHPSFRGTFPPGEGFGGFAADCPCRCKNARSERTGHWVMELVAEIQDVLKAFLEDLIDSVQDLLALHGNIVLQFLIDGLDF